MTTMTKHTIRPVANPFNADATVCAECGGPVAKVNADAAQAGFKHYTSTAAYKARVLAAMAEVTTSERAGGAPFERGATMDYSLPCFCADYSRDADGMPAEVNVAHRLGTGGCKYPPQWGSLA